MEFVEVKELPKGDWRRNPRRDIRNKLEKFVGMNIKIALVTFDEGEYLNVSSAVASIRGCINRADYPILVSHHQDQVYFIRTDM